MRRIAFMTSIAVAFGCLGLAGAPSAAHAQDINTSLRNAAVVSTDTDPRAFIPAPVPELGGSRLPPSERAGGAADAGPMNATPFAGPVSSVLTGSQTARALDDTSPDRDPVGASQFRD